MQDKKTNKLAQWKDGNNASIDKSKKVPCRCKKEFTEYTAFTV